MNPFRWDVLLVGFVLAVPVLALGLRGDFTTEEVVSRLPWCLAAGWAAVALLRAVVAPPKPAPERGCRPAARPGPVDEDAD
ncbi:hypothetical protein [Blastococcus capsensis]|uniref:hypothetical protein n=1 Tax=Blastococcus capsensis TaxID=1564163 RepID=UPI00254236D8|nr:hypothetical protein [Blastococcus capsensis]MDK3257388.1 hypothetical protein [Blastococcus capsensis]